MATTLPSKIDWQFSSLPRATKKALDFLSTQNWLRQSKWYLAGGTALALQMGHRVSVDLDFFTTLTDFKTTQLVNHFKGTDWQSTDIDRGTVYGILLGAKVSFIAYPFFVPTAPPHRYGSVRVLDARDIAVMKIIAISQRGRKRDFFDLYWYVKNCEPLVDIMHRLKLQYPTVAHDYHHIIKSLVYFADAENDPMPKINFIANWKQVKKFFMSEMKRITPKLLQLT